MFAPQDPAVAISELIETFGYTEKRIAKEVCELDEALTLSQSSIHRIKRGDQEPRFGEGLAILKLRDRARHDRAESEGGVETESTAVSGAR